MFIDIFRDMLAELSKTEEDGQLNTAFMSSFH